MERWLVLDVDGKVVGGPYLWDGKTPWTAPEPGSVVKESEYLARRAAELNTPTEE
jgi:hypothetical protein